MTAGFDPKCFRFANKQAKTTYFIAFATTSPVQVNLWIIQNMRKPAVCSQWSYERYSI